MLDKQVNKSDIGVETNFKLRVLQHLPEGAQEILEGSVSCEPAGFSFSMPKPVP